MFETIAKLTDDRISLLLAEQQKHDDDLIFSHCAIEKFTEQFLPSQLRCTNNHIDHYLKYYHVTESILHKNQHKKRQLKPTEKETQNALAKRKLDSKIRHKMKKTHYECTTIEGEVNENLYYLQEFGEQKWKL